jgi:hypothetical protein
VPEAYTLTVLGCRIGGMEYFSGYPPRHAA